MPKILCVEDEADIRELISEALELEGFDVYEAENGKVGLESILKHNPDLILCDINMPIMDGRMLLKELRSNHPTFVETPFIFLTAMADRKDVISGLNTGADDYLTKPLDLEMLAVKVNSALRQVTLMAAKKQKEQVKLYNTLTAEKNAPMQPEPGVSSNPSLNIALVGKQERDHSAIEKMLDNMGHTIKRFSSGKLFVEQIEELDLDLALIGFYTDDMQGNLVTKFAKLRLETDMPYVLLWPEVMASSPHTPFDKLFSDTLNLPCNDANLRDIIKNSSAD